MRWLGAEMHLPKGSPDYLPGKKHIFIIMFGLDVPHEVSTVVILLSFVTRRLEAV